MAMANRDRLIEFLQMNGVTDNKVLEVMYSIPRDLFISEAMYHQAYENNALPIGYNQTISQPYIVGKMTSLLELTPSTKVLEIGTGSGYQTAVLAKLVDHVYSVERIKALQWNAKRLLKRLGLYNISTKHGDGWQGWASKGPFDAIIVTAAAESIPYKLLEQLTDRGIMVIPVGKDQQKLIRIERQGDRFHHQEIEMVRFVPLIAGELA